MKTRNAKQVVTQLGMMVVAFSLSAASAQAEPQSQGLIVKYRTGVKRVRELMNPLYEEAGVKSVRRMKGLAAGYEEIQLVDGVSTQDAMAVFANNPLVEYVEPNYVLSIPQDENFQELEAPEMFDDAPCIIPGVFPPGCSNSRENPPVQPAPAEVIPPKADPNMADAYGIFKVGADSVWKTHTGSKKMIVAVIDTGIDYNHPDLSFNMWRNPKANAEDLVGYNFASDTPFPFDDNRHGTHCAGTVGAVGGNGVGVSGVNQRVSLMAVKFLTSKGSGTTANAIRAIDYAVKNGAKVLSNSWGGTGATLNNQSLKDAIARAEKADVLFVAAAGNSTVDNDSRSASYPASFDNDNIVAVASTDSSDKLSSFSNYGSKSVDVGAPGTAVYSTIPGGYGKLSGTSMACPHVAGAAALVWSKFPKMTYKDVKKLLMDSVDQLPALAGKTVTGGRINVATAFRVARAKIQ